MHFSLFVRACWCAPEQVGDADERRTRHQSREGTSNQLIKQILSGRDDRSANFAAARGLKVPDMRCGIHNIYIYTYSYIYIWAA